MIREELHECLKRAALQKFPAFPIEEDLIEEPKLENFGDYATSVALKIAKKTGKQPREVAEQLLAAIELPPHFLTPAIAGGGFINFSFSPKFLLRFIGEILKNPAALQPSFGKGKVAVTDTSHPNIAKPMGVHHMLSTIIGDSINRLLAYCGYRVIRDNYLGDWGTQFGKLIYAFKTFGKKSVIEKNPIPELLKLYVKFHDRAEKDETLEEEGRRAFKKLEEGDPENRKLWQWMRDASLVEFHKMWNILGVTFDVINGESFYEDKMKPIIEKGRAEKVFVKGEKGALICEFPKEGYPVAVIQKADGATLYATRDLARIKHWEDTWRPDLMVNVVDSAQTLYFRQLYSMAERLSLTDAKNIHVAFGRMRFPDKRMSTRKGNIVLLEELIDEVITLARKIVEEKNPDFPSGEKAEIARKVGIGALKFVVLNQNRETDVTFTWEKMLSLEGESAPYLQYVAARCRGILRKAGDDAPSIPAGDQTVALEAEEISLTRLFPKFHETVASAAREFRPNILARYLSKLATRFNLFYDKHPVLRADPPLRGMRLSFVKAALTVLETGLSLLGIEAPEQM